jgi:hypothetical protein
MTLPVEITFPQLGRGLSPPPWRSEQMRVSSGGTDRNWRRLVGGCSGFCVVVIKGDQYIRFRITGRNGALGDIVRNRRQPAHETFARFRSNVRHDSDIDEIGLNRICRLYCGGPHRSQTTGATLGGLGTFVTNILVRLVSYLLEVLGVQPQFLINGRR